MAAQQQQMTTPASTEVYVLKPVNVTTVQAGEQPKIIGDQQQQTTPPSTEAYVLKPANVTTVLASEHPKIIDDQQQQQTTPASTVPVVSKPVNATAALAGERPKTIGDALEDAALHARDKPLELKDARAIQSAEARATGIATGVAGGPAAYAMHLLDTQATATLGDALQDAKSYLPSDKVVTQRDVSGVTKAEARNHPVGTPALSSGGVAASMQAAAQYNINKGFVPNSRNQSNANASPTSAAAMAEAAP